MGRVRVGVPHPRPVPWARGVVGPLADPSGKFLVQPREFLARKALHPTHPPAPYARGQTPVGGGGVTCVAHRRVSVRSLQRSPPFLGGHPSSPRAPVHQSGVVRSGRALRGRHLWVHSCVSLLWLVAACVDRAGGSAGGRCAGSRPAGAWQDHGVGGRSQVDGPPVGGIWTTCAAMPEASQRSTRPGSRASSRA
jgi:hypothetical protein